MKSMEQSLRVNIVSESDISVQGHGVHTAYVEMVNALRDRPDVAVIPGAFGENVACDIIHLHTVGPRVWRKLRQRGPKKVISAHVVPDSFIGSLVGAKYWRFLAVWYLRWIYNQADALLAVSNETKRDLLDMGVRAPITVLYNAIDTTLYRPKSGERERIRQRLAIAPDAFVVIGAGQVQPRKRIDDFLEVAAQLPDVHFIWMGGMPFGKVAAGSRRLEQMMEQSPVNVSFPGIVPLEEMPAYYQAADMFFLPSEQETFGLVVVEAAASGLPVMLRDIPDYQETFRTDALLGSSVSEFVKHITTLSSDVATCEVWRRHAATIAQRFDSRAATQQLVELYRELQSSPRP